MSHAKDLAILYALQARRSGSLFNVWESPDKRECWPLRDYKPAPGPGWVKVWPVEKSETTNGDGGHDS
ncbi:unnamed protein product [marine sediment metagenome]|uniref:Uncharacterized protein n=1 Tax=marine sediment metagenome TaxID=412755 RepID=X0XPQ8_9ZZZZ